MNAEKESRYHFGCHECLEFVATNNPPFTRITHHPNHVVTETICEYCYAESTKFDNKENKPDFLNKVRATLDEREGDYGNAQEMFDKIAARWSITLGHTITARQVALCMVDLKLSRLSIDLNHDDSMVDVAG
jgi:hypothetical protein